VGRKRSVASSLPGGETPQVFNGSQTIGSDVLDRVLQPISDHEFVLYASGVRNEIGMGAITRLGHA